MIKDNNVQDYLFTTYDFPQEFQNGFEGYVKLRDSI